jgi:hypothetical protein
LLLPILSRPWVVPLILAASLSAADKAVQAPSESEVKAAFLHNFTKFVEWPASAFSDERSSLKICVLGEDPFGGRLAAIVSEEVAGRKLTVWQKESISDPSGCHILFVRVAEGERLSKVLSAVRSLPVLTVGDTRGFLEKGGIINFVLEEGKVRFEINQGAAEQAGLKLSSKLLQLAARVVPAAGAGP